MAGTTVETRYFVRELPTQKWAEFEIRAAAGPITIGETGDGTYATLFGVPYVGYLDKYQNKLVLLKYDGSSWVPVDESLFPQPPHPVEEIRHIAVAFDQAARLVLAYERAGEVFVYQWDPVTHQYIVRGPFPGVDPVLLCDASVMFRVPDSDVLLFYLSTDRTQLLMRVQRENYANPHTLHTFTAPVLLDQVVQYPYRLALVGSRCDSPAETGYWLNSHLYPIHVVDGPVVATAAPLDAEYLPSVLRHEQGEATLLLLSPAPQSMDYVLFPPITYSHPTPERVGATPEPRNMLYTPAVIAYSHPTPERVGATPAPQNMLYALAAIRYTWGPEGGVAVQPQPQSMRYYV